MAELWFDLFADLHQLEVLPHPPHRQHAQRPPSWASRHSPEGHSVERKQLPAAL